MGKNPYDYDEIVRQRFTITLRSFMDKHGMSCKSLAREVGIDVRTIESHRAGKTLPEHVAQWRYIRYFGAAFLNELSEPAGITGSFNHDGEEACHYSLITHLAHFMHILSKAAEDGVIDDDERKVIRHMLPGVKAIINAFEGGL